MAQQVEVATDEVEFCAGLDLGRITDPSAFALFERRRPKLVRTGPVAVEAEFGPMGEVRTTTFQRQPFTGALTRDERRQRLWRYDLKMMQVWDGRPYDEVLQWLVMAYSRPVDQDGLAGTVLAVDYTGVGVAVVEWLIKEMSLAKVKCKVRPVWITGGGRVVERDDVAGWNVPKSELVSVLQMLMGTKRLRVEQSDANCTGLVAEFDNFKIKVNHDTGHESYEAWRSNEHDDRVLAAAVGLWCAERGQKEFWVR